MLLLPAGEVLEELAQELHPPAPGALDGKLASTAKLAARQTNKLLFITSAHSFSCFDWIGEWQGLAWRAPSPLVIELQTLCKNISGPAALLTQHRTISGPPLSN
jgi:hypothetical protein